MGSSSTTIPNPANEAAAFLARFDQPEVNDLGPADFWASSPPYVDFCGFQVPKDCVSHLVMIYSNSGDFMQEFRLGHFAREHFLKMFEVSTALLTLSLPRGSCSGGPRFRSLSVWVLLWGLF